MQLEGSCHCGAVRFNVQSPHPYPFNLCYCSICRKTAGGGGFAINLGADNDTLKVEMLGSKANWVQPCTADSDKCFEEYPDESLAEWHERLGLKR